MRLYSDFSEERDGQKRAEKKHANQTATELLQKVSRSAFALSIMLFMAGDRQSRRQKPIGGLAAHIGWFALRAGAVPHLSDKPGELSQRPCRDDSDINTVPRISIIRTSNVHNR